MMLKFLFIQPEFENIGLEYISSVLKKHGHLVDLVFIPRPLSNTAFNIAEENNELENVSIMNKISGYQPDIICFSPFTSYFKWAVDKAAFIKSKIPGSFILFGGVHATFIPEMTIAETCIDAVLIGEGEKAIVDFCNNFFSMEKLKQTSNVWIKDKGIVYKNPLAPLIHLDELPYPDKDLFYDHFPGFQKRDTFTIMTSRGCPYRCAYCCNSVYNKMYNRQKIIRYQSSEYILEQLLFFKKKYGFKRVDFMDDVFATNISRLSEFLPAYKEKINLPFVCFMYPNTMTANDEILKLLKDNGCEWLKIGVQSANETYRKTVLKRNETNEMIIKIADLCKKQKIKFSFDHILQLPGETKEDLMDAVLLYKRCRPDIINFGSLIYLPKTPIVQYGYEKGELTRKDIERINQGRAYQALSSNIQRFKGNSEKLNYSVFVLLFILISILPERVTDFLLKNNILDCKRKIPGIFLILAKVVSKVKAGQGYIYYSAVRYTVYHIFSKIIRLQ